eukprot:s2121_g7.t2
MMRSMGFGNQGQATSQDCSIHVCTICRAPIKLSYFVLFFFMYDLINIGRRGGTDIQLLWSVLRAVANECVLLLTILCHEFGHGNMARYLGGEISHILLWVFGGICFHTRPRNDSADNTILLKNDLMVVAAGPSTHFVQAPLWGLVLWLLYVCIEAQGGSTGYASAWAAFTDSLNPLGGGASWFWVEYTVNQWMALLWSVVASAISLNVALFLFNVFFPMYPADGAKLLVTSLMFFCGVPARKAALVLICTSVPCALAMIGYTVYALFEAGVRGLMGSLMGWMGVMSLMEARNIYKLRKARQLHTHPLFEVAKSWRRTERDAFGVVHRINQSDFDDEAPLTSGGWRNFCSLFRRSEPTEQRLIEPSSRSRCICCPCFDFVGSRSTVEEQEIVPPQATATEQQAALRAQRDQFVQRMEQQRMDQARSVRDLTTEERSPSSRI